DRRRGRSGIRSAAGVARSSTRAPGATGGAPRPARASGAAGAARATGAAGAAAGGGAGVGLSRRRGTTAGKEKGRRDRRDCKGGQDEGVGLHGGASVARAPTRSTMQRVRAGSRALSLQSSI